MDPEDLTDSEAVYCMAILLHILTSGIWLYIAALDGPHTAWFGLILMLDIVCIIAAEVS